jgi:hypothetical protein
VLLKSDLYVQQTYLSFCGLYYKPIMMVNDDSRVINKLETLPTDDDRVVIYGCHMFIVQALLAKEAKNKLVIATDLFDSHSLVDL